MKDVARRAGVSTATVSRVLNGHTAPTEQTRARVLAAIDELGYRPNALARSLRVHRTRTLGLVISDLLNPFFAEIARAVEDEARAHGYSVVFGNADESPEQQVSYVRTLLDRRVDGLLVCPANGDDGGWAAEVAERGVPLVLLDRTVAGVAAPVVRADGTGALRDLAALLVRAGHRRVGVIAGPDGTSTGRDRLAAFRTALAEVGAPLEPALLRRSDVRQASGAEAAGQLVGLPDPPTALVAMDNLTGVGVLVELRRRGLRVGVDVGLAVYDDQPWFQLLDPPLTVIAQPVVEMGGAAARSLLALVDGRQPADVELRATLVARGSCGEVVAP